MDDPGVNTPGPKIHTNSPQNGVITINDEADVVMISPDKETPSSPMGEPPAQAEITISDDEPEAKTTNLEEIVISDDDNDCGVTLESPDDGEVSEVPEACIVEDTPQENERAPAESQEKRIEITFSSSELLSEYSQKFRAFLVHTLKEFTYLDDATANKIILTNDAALKDFVVVNSVEDDDYEHAVDENGKKRKRKDQNKSEDRDSLFMLDTDPSNEISRCPIYRSKYKVIEDVPEGETKSDEGRKREENKISCFNCSGEHNLRDCPLPKDQRRIKLARQKIIKHVRYHEEGEVKYSNLKPGVLSDSLKIALGVRKHELPQHVYKMRVMGYPPGWLEEAKVFQSNLALFDSNGKKDASSRAASGYTIDPEKIVEYPGFNCKPDRGCRDDYNFHRVPPYSTALSKENMIEFVNKALQQDTNEQEPPVPGSKSPSPSLVDLELQKRQLLEQLTTNDDSNTSNPSNPSTTPAETPTEETPCDLSMSMNTTHNHTQDEQDLNLDSDNTTDRSLMPSTPVTPATPTPSTRSTINSSLPGTPIIKSLSPYARLPSLDKFQKDVSDMINFENLPNSTGKYEQMTAVLEKVRSTLKSRMQTPT